jgi:adenine-specific DNA methylase
MAPLVSADTSSADIEISGKNRNIAKFPSTRYQGSKNKIIDWIWDCLSDYSFDSVLDGFGGTGVFSYKAKTEGLRAEYNDFLRFNHQVGTAIIENDATRVDHQTVDELFRFDQPAEAYPTTVRDEFEGLYFTDEENEWLDKFRSNIDRIIDEPYKKAIVFAALSQACLVKRPYNLFHRANLNMRTRDVERSFGNKTTWEKPFEKLVRKFIVEYNSAVFANPYDHRAYNRDIISWQSPPETDLVYFDPPYYVRDRSQPVSNYKLYYHFLDGYIDYDNWADKINRSLKTKRLKHSREPWNDPELILDAFHTIFNRFSDRHIALSYNTEAAPLPETVEDTLAEYKRNVTTYRLNHQYALSENDSDEELLIVGSD